MFFDPIEIPDELLDAQEQGGLVIFAGAGVSMGEPSNLPSFKGLAAHIAGNHPLAAEIDKYESRLDRFLGDLSRQKVDVQGLCRAKISDPSSRPTDLHSSILNLFVKPEHVRVVTTNFDRHFGTLISEHGWKLDNYFAPALPLGHQFSGIVYLHGSILRQENLVLTDEDFGRAYLTEGWAREFLQRLFMEFTTLFIGYSHNDIPVEYLARGMSGKSIGTRFAITAAGEAGLWASLGIREITFKKSSGQNPFANLRVGLKKWVDFTKQQPTEIAERVKNIVCSPDNVVPDESQSSLLKRCLEREVTCHLFTTEAKGWRWVKWLQERGFLTPLFEPQRRNLTNSQWTLANWLARVMVNEVSDGGLLLVEKHNGLLGRQLWSALVRELWLNNELSWSNPLVQKWVILLVETCPRESVHELSHLFPKAVKAAPQTLAMVMLRHLILLHVTIRPSVDFAALMKGEDTFNREDKAEFEIALLGEIDELGEGWEYLLANHFEQLGESMLVMMENCIREGHDIYRTAGRGSSSYDPSSFRGRIYERDAYRTGGGMTVVLDFLLDVVEAHVNRVGGFTATRIEAWLVSHVPVLVRVGLYALHLSKGISDSQKVEIVQKYNLVHPEVHGATHEVWLLLAQSYPSLTASAKVSLWQMVNEGPKTLRQEDVTPKAWDDFRRREIDKLTWLLGTKHPDCPIAKQVLEKLKERRPDFQGYIGMDQVILGDTKVIKGPLTPRTVGELLNESPVSQIDWLLKYEGGNHPFGKSREGLLSAVGAACAQNHAWGIALLEALESRKAWTSDLWDAAYWRMSLSKLPPGKLTWLLKLLETHFANSPSLQGLSFFLFHNVDFSDEKRPDAETLSLMIRLSLLIWNQIKNSEPAVTEGFNAHEWAHRSINHPAGRIVGFWLKYCSFQQREPNPPIPGFPDWLKEPLADMVKGADLASQLGRATLGLHLRFLYHLDPAWTAAQLFPKMMFSVVGGEAFLIWEPHAGYGELSRDLILMMPLIYREAFLPFREVEGYLLTGFLKHISVITYSCLININEQNWFRDFLVGLSEDQKTHWARLMERGLGDAPEERKAQIWQRWMKRYWQDRLSGIPCELKDKEAQEMVEWIFVVGQAFPEAVNFVLRGPRVTQKFGIIIHRLEKHEAPEKYPETVLRLLNWLVQDTNLHSSIPNDIESLVMRLPKKKSFLRTLNSICQHLVSRAYPRASELKRAVEREFTAD